jgi:methylated-DNA-[protein]-cysteine S-methyltransferase
LARPAGFEPTPFQREVWTALRTIPVGTTVSYRALAGRLNRPQAMRAVGMANNANPTGVVVPCHRVIGADGSLTGYGGGLPRKRWLLEHEGVDFDRLDRSISCLQRNPPSAAPIIG